jgi:NADPH:quinone reductase-like Zn-dependent oxidoreductase
VKAILYENYGPPEVLQLKEVEKPTPNAGEVLVRVQAASASPFDWHLMRGAPLLARISHGLRRPKVPQFGADLAGTVDSVGPNVTQFHPGDEVFGESMGSFAEYVTVSEDKLAGMPPNVTFDGAATVGISGVTALQALCDLGHVRAGTTVLINGASGGIGTFAVQIAKSFGAEITGVCGSRNLGLVRSLGADHVIDYTKEDFSRSGLRYDLVLDAVGNVSVSDYRRSLSPHGIGVGVGFTSMSRLLRVWIGGTLVSRKEGRRIVVKTTPVNKAALVVMRDLLAAGKVVPVIDRRYTLKEVREAIAYLEEGHAQGKVVIAIGPGCPTGRFPDSVKRAQPAGVRPVDARAPAAAPS